MEGDHSGWGNLRRRALRRTKKLIGSVELPEDDDTDDMEEGLDTERLVCDYDGNVEEGLNIEVTGECEEMQAGFDGDIGETESEHMWAEHRFDSGDEMDNSSTDTDLRSSLADWAIEFGISLIALSALLSILKIHHPFLPKDGRTLLGTKTKYAIETVTGGVFHYFGILNAFRRILENPTTLRVGG